MTLRRLCDFIPTTAAAFMLAVLLSANAANARTHRVAVDVTIQRCTPFSCKIIRLTWVSTAVAIGRIGETEYLVSNHHAFVGTPKTSLGVTEKLIAIHGIKIKTRDAGDFPAKLVGMSKVYGGSGDLALLSVKSSREWNSWELLKADLTPGTPITVEGYSLGRFSRRGGNVVSYSKNAGMQTTGRLGPGGSGSAIAYNGKLAGIAWGSQWDRRFGTFGTPSAEIVEFVRGKLGRMPGGVAQDPVRTSPAKTVTSSTGSSSGGDGRQCAICAADFTAMRSELAALRKSLDKRKPTDVSAIVTAFNKLSGKVSALESRKPTDVSAILDGINALSLKLATMETRNAILRQSIAKLRGLIVPIRIETSDGKLIAKKRLAIIEVDGRLELKPIVLKFDEKILTGGK